MTGKTKLKSALDQLTRSGALVKIVYLADAVSVTVKARDGQKHGFVASGKGRKKGAIAKRLMDIKARLYVPRHQHCWCVIAPGKVTPPEAEG